MATIIFLNCLNNRLNM